MKISKPMTSDRKRLVRPALPLLALALVATLLGVSQVQGGGGGGGVEIYPVAYSGPPGNGGSLGPAKQWITLHSPTGSLPVPGSMSDPGVRIRKHRRSDIVTALPQGAGDDWSLDLNLLSPDLRVWDGFGMINLDGHFMLTDSEDGDGEDLRLHNGVDGVRSRLLIVVGQRRRHTGKLGVPESFTNVMQVLAMPVPGNQVSLESARKSLVQALHGSGLDVALGLFTQDGSGVVSQTWAAFSTDDHLNLYEIQTR